MANHGEVDINMFTTPFQLTKGLHRDVYPYIDTAKLAQYAEKNVVMITGATGGLGFEIAKTWSNAGAKGVILVARDMERLKKSASELELKDNHLLVSANVTNEEEVNHAFDEAVKKFGAVDVVINTAGTMNLDSPIGKIAPSQWWIDHETNVKGTYNLAHFFIRVTGGKGTFINLVSLAASFVSPGLSSYSIAKLSALRLAEYLDSEQPELRTFSIHPGIVEASSDRGMIVDNFTPFAKDNPILTAAFTMYLMRPEADFLRGGYVSVNWDVEEMENHREEISVKKLLKLGFIGASLGPEGHPWRN